MTKRVGFDWFVKFSLPCVKRVHDWMKYSFFFSFQTLRSMFLRKQRKI